VGLPNGPGTEADSNGLAVGPPAAAGTASPASARPAGSKLKPANGAAAQGEEALATPAAELAKGAAAEVHKATEALRAPLTLATSVTADLVEAAIGADSRGLGSKARRTGAGLATALAVTAVATRRRRRCGPPRVNPHAAPARMARS